MEKTKSRTKTKLLWQFLRGSKRYFCVGALATSAVTLLDMLTPQIIRVTIESVLDNQAMNLPGFAVDLLESIGGRDFLRTHLWWAAVAVLTVAGLSAVCKYLTTLYNTKAAEKLVKTMRDELFEHIQHLPFSWHMKNQTGDMIQRCTSDVDTTKQFISAQLVNVFRIVLMLVLSLVFMFSMNIKLALVALVTFPIIIAFSAGFHGKIGHLFTECDENEGVLSTIAQENLTGVRVVRAFGREKYEKDRFEKQNNKYTDAWMDLCVLLAKFWATGDTLSGLQVMLMVVLGSVLCVQGDMSSGELVAFISYNAMLVWPIRQLGRMISEMSKAGVSIDRVAYIMHSPIEEDDPDAAEAPMDGDIAFEHVRFGYENAPEILHDIHFTIKAGTTLGILGGTGSGKSTLMLLLDKLYPLAEDCGRITIGGTDIRKIKTDHLRRNIGMVLQEPYLFSRTIGENIGITADRLDMDAVRSAAAAAALDESIAAFANGYDTMVGERGVTLSGGQKQRAAIARMLTGSTPIMIFDDSLSAVDTETDAKIRQAIAQRFGKATVILISHRITTLSAADKIIVLDKGRIAEEGTHEELKCGGGIYQKICETQYRQ